jgi:phosphoglycolate phosphatase-like HAD superfamily hydrolase
MNHSIVYALDFDGVICDSAVETAITGWKCADRIWNDMPEAVPQEMIDAFRRVRPIIETGYEAILAMRLLHLGDTVDAIYSDFAVKSQNLMTQAGVTPGDLKKLFGDTRDRWIEADLDDWIRMNPLFEGIPDKLRPLSRQGPWYIVTTKQERFVSHILRAQRIELAEERIYGLDRNMSKPEVLKTLLKAHPDKRLLFVEDRLPALQVVRKDNELAGVELMFALWGYNTAEDKALAVREAIPGQQLADFLVF